MAIMTHAKFHFNWLMLTLIFGIWASEPPPGSGERLKRPGLIGLRQKAHLCKQFQGPNHEFRFQDKCQKDTLSVFTGPFWNPLVSDLWKKTD